MQKFKKRWMIIFLFIIFLLISNLPVAAVSDLEKKIAKKNLKRYTKKYGIAKLKPAQRKKVTNLFNNLAAKANQDAKNLEFKLHVVDTPVLNAVYLGDGHVMLFKGLLRALEDENELAAVLAHELGHGVNNDIQDKIDLIQGIQIGNVLIDLMKDGKVNQEEPDFITALSWQLLQKGFSREQEREADRYSVFLLKRAGYNPQGTVGLMKVLKRKQKRVNDSKLLELFSAHPNVNNRIEYLTQINKKLQLAEKLYYSPISTSQLLTEGLLEGNIQSMYSTYSKQIHNRYKLEEFKQASQVNKVKNKIKDLKSEYKLKYSLELRNQVANTARVAICFYDVGPNRKEQESFNKRDPVISLAVDLIKEQYSWKVLRGPVTY